MDGYHFFKNVKSGDEFGITFVLEDGTIYEYAQGVVQVGEIQKPTSHISMLRPGEGTWFCLARDIDAHNLVKYLRTKTEMVL
jgi:hypothetical protein